MDNPDRHYFVEAYQFVKEANGSLEELKGFFSQALTQPMSTSSLVSMLHWSHRVAAAATAVSLKISDDILLRRIVFSEAAENDGL